MLPLLLFAFAAGALTILSPCTLPVVPLVIGIAGPDRRWRLLGFVIGFGLMFVGVTVVFATALTAANISIGWTRMAAAIAVGAFGVTIAVPSLGNRLEFAWSRTTDLGRRSTQAGPTDGLAVGLVLGSAIGLIWAPCAGPIMAAVIASAVAAGPSAQAALVAGAYVLGASLPLTLVALGGRRAMSRMGSARRRARLGQSFGAVMVVTAGLVVTGLDVPLQLGAANLLPPNVSAALLSVEQQPAAQEGLTVLRASRSPAPAVTTPPDAATGSLAATLPAPIATTLPATVSLDDGGVAPALTGITAWINSPPLDLASLRGKVVLVHFWTFDCINCLDVQPYVKAWYARYAAAGFVVIGVHTPELAAERDLANVRAAVAQDGVLFPVAFDPNFATWNAYRNQYWPAFYFIDKAGHIRHVHFGEGDYDGSEQVIRQLLAEPAPG